MSYVSQPPEYSRPLLATLMAVAIHGALWIAFLVGLYRLVPPLARTFRDFNMKLPAATAFVIDLSKWIVNYVWLMLPLVILALVVDGGVYYLLRCTTPRFVSVLWSAFMIVLPIVAIVWTIIAVWLPVQDLHGGLSK